LANGSTDVEEFVYTECVVTTSISQTKCFSVLQNTVPKQKCFLFCKVELKSRADRRVQKEQTNVYVSA